MGKTLVGLLVLLLACAGCSADASSQAQSSPNPAKELTCADDPGNVVLCEGAGAEFNGIDQKSPTTAWYPEGYTDAGDGIAYAWASLDPCPDDRLTCFEVRVVARDGCPDGLYVEATKEDRYGIAFGYANDRVEYVGKGLDGRALVTFMFTDGRTARMSNPQFSCR